jgi:hypothetical protein
MIKAAFSYRNPDRVSVNLHPGVGDSAAEQSVFITLEFIIPEKVTCPAI